MIQTKTDTNYLDLRAILLRGAEVWNLWRLEHPGISINLRGADLQFANLQGADLQFADLQFADLQFADLQGANLQGANLQGANFQYATLQYADLRLTKLELAKLQGANLRNANLQGANFRDTDLRGVNLRGAKLQDADFQGANLQGVEHLGIKLLGAMIKGVKLLGIKFFGKTTDIPKIQIEQTFHIKVFDHRLNPDALAQLEHAVDAYAEAIGYSSPEVLSETYGSFFKNVKRSLAKFLTDELKEEATEVGVEFYRSGKAYAQRKLERTGDESTQQIAEATVALLKAVQPFDNVVLVLGKLIVIKHTQDDGKSKVFVKSVSTELQNKLEAAPELLESPQAIISFLQEHGTLPQPITQSAEINSMAL
jgi:hypothetical protein